MVRGGGLEPPQCYPLEPEVSENRRRLRPTRYHRAPNPTESLSFSLATSRFQQPQTPAADAGCMTEPITCPVALPVNAAELAVWLALAQLAGEDLETWIVRQVRAALQRAPTA